MQIELPKDIETLIQQRAAAAGFPGEIAAYVAHLVKADATENFGGPEHLSIVKDSKADLDAKIDAGFLSGPASPMTKNDWQELQNRIDASSLQRVQIITHNQKNPNGTEDMP